MIRLGLRGLKPKCLNFWNVNQTELNHKIVKKLQTVKPLMFNSFVYFVMYIKHEVSGLRM